MDTAHPPCQEPEVRVKGKPQEADGVDTDDTFSRSSNLRDRWDQPHTCLLARQTSRCLREASIDHIVGRKATFGSLGTKGTCIENPARTPTSTLTPVP